MSAQLRTGRGTDILTADKENFNPAARPTGQKVRSTEQAQPWELIRALDEEEKWAERVQIVTKQDHLIYLAMAEEVVRDAVENAMRQSGEITPEEHNSGTAEQMEAHGAAEEDFASPSKAIQQLELDYLDKMASTGGAGAANARLRESLYTRFDPLLSEAGAQPHPPAHAPPPRTGARTPPFARKRLEAIPQSPAAGEEDTLIQLTPARPAAPAPTLVPAPAPAHAVAPAPAPAPDTRVAGPARPTVAQRALPTVEDPGSPLVAVLKYSEKDMTLAKRAIKEEADREIESLRAQVKALTEQASAESDKNKNLAKILDDYESVMTGMLGEMESQKASHAQSLQTAIKERDQALGEVRSVETAFSDLHRRYEKLKEAADGMKKNEDALKQSLAAAQQDLVTFEQRYMALKRHAEEKIEQANQEIERVRAAHATEIAVVSAKLKKSELAIAGLERTLAQKEQENKELVTICDELIAKVK